MAGDSQAQIGIFGDVMRIPTAQILQRMAAEKQRRAAQRHRQPQPFYARQEQPEPDGIFGGETACQPVVAGVVEIQHALQAHDLGVANGKPFNHFADLVGGGGIFGVIDPDDRPTTMIQRIVQGAGLGFHHPGRNRDHPHPCGQRGARQSVSRQHVVFFDHQQHIQQFSRVVQPPQPLNQTRGDIAFAVKRHHRRNEG